MNNIGNILSIEIEYQIWIGTHTTRRGDHFLWMRFTAKTAQ